MVRAHIRTDEPSLPLSLLATLSLRDLCPILDRSPASWQEEIEKLKEELRQTKEDLEVSLSHTLSTMLFLFYSAFNSKFFLFALCPFPLSQLSQQDYVTLLDANMKKDLQIDDLKGI
jgi:hypothetical protein